MKNLDLVHKENSTSLLEGAVAVILPSSLLKHYILARKTIRHDYSYFEIVIGKYSLVMLLINVVNYSQILKLVEIVKF